MATFDDVANRVLPKYSKKITEAIKIANPLWFHLTEKKSVVNHMGGENIDITINNAENLTVGWRDGKTDLLDWSFQEVFGNALYPLRWLTGSLVWTKGEKDAAKYPEQIIDVMAGKMKVLKTSLVNNAGVSVYGDGSTGKALYGLQHLIPDDPTTGTCAGIDRSTASYVNQAGTTIYYWRSHKSSGVTGSSNIQAKMDALWTDCINGADSPDLIIAGKTYFKYYRGSLSKTITTSDKNTGYMGDSGFTHLRFMDVPVVLDKNCSDTRMYFINSNHMELRRDPNNNFTGLPEARIPRQLAWAKDVIWRGQLVITDMQRHGVLIA